MFDKNNNDLSFTDDLGQSKFVSNELQTIEFMIIYERALKCKVSRLLGSRMAA